VSVSQSTRIEKDEQVLGGIGFTAEHGLNRHVRRALVLDGLLGSAGELSREAGARLAYKLAFCTLLERYLAAWGKRGCEVLLMGDYNIAHRPIDLRNWKANQKNSGFLPEERAWMDQLFGPAGFVDAFRELRPEAEAYTWWSNRGRARANDVGWRIDYQVVSKTLAGRARAATIYKKQRFSDHAPLIMDYDL